MYLQKFAFLYIGMYVCICMSCDLYIHNITRDFNVVGGTWGEGRSRWRFDEH